MFFKTTETCTIDTSERYVNGEADINIFKADSLEEMTAYFTGINDYLIKNGLEVTIELVEDDNIEAACEEFGCEVMDVKEFN